MNRLTKEQKEFIKNNDKISYKKLIKIYEDKYNMSLSKSLLSYYRTKGLNAEERKERHKHLSNLGIEKSKMYELDRMYEYIDKLKNNQVKGQHGKTASNYIRKYLFMIHHNKCEECGWSKQNPRTRRTPLEIHHNDGDFENNNLNNLKLLCPNCHSLTNTFRSNKNGRTTRHRVKKLY